MNQISGYTLGGNAVDVDYDDNGNTIQIGNQFMDYDDADRLTSVIQVNPATQENIIKTEYVYDGLGRRSIAITYSWDAGNETWIQQNECRFIYDGMDLIQERDGSNNIIASYVRDGNIGGALSRTTPSGTYYYHYDGNGNVVAMTNSSGTIVAEYTYDAYGNLTAMSGSQAADNPIRFSTKYFDGDTGYYDFGFRSYDPVTGRWLNRDPIGEEGGLNLYGFVGNSPGNVLDAYGLDVIVNIRGGDAGIVKHFNFLFGMRKIKGGKGDTVIDLIKPTKKEALDALSKADQFYFWGHGSFNSKIWLNDDETLSYEDINRLARIRNKRGMGKMSSVSLESCYSASGAKGINLWLKLTSKFTGYVGLTFHKEKLQVGNRRTFKSPVNYDPYTGPRSGQKPKNR